MKPVSFVVALLLAVAGGSQKEPRIAEGFIAAWNSHDAEKVIPIYTDDVFFEDVTLGAVSRGSEEMRKFATSTFAAQEVDRRVDEDNFRLADKPRASCRGRRLTVITNWREC